MGWILLACDFPDAVCVLVCGLFVWVSSLHGFCVAWVASSSWWCFCSLMFVRLHAAGFDLCFCWGLVSGILVVFAYAGVCFRVLMWFDFSGCKGGLVIWLSLGVV